MTGVIVAKSLATSILLKGVARSWVNILHIEPLRKYRLKLGIVLKEIPGKPIILKGPTRLAFVPSLNAD